jgi:hypothetical protein
MTPELIRSIVLDVHTAWSVAGSKRWAETGDASEMPRRWRELVVQAAARAMLRVAQGMPL